MARIQIILHHFHVIQKPYSLYITSISLLQAFLLLLCKFVCGLSTRELSASELSENLTKDVNL